MGDHTEELPEYSPGPRPPLIRTGYVNSSQEHRFVLRDKSGREWLSFKMRSRAVDPKYMPMFFDGDVIKGLVLLDLAKPETLKGLTVTVCIHYSFPVISPACVVPVPNPNTCHFLMKDSRGDDCRRSRGGTLPKQNRAGLDASIGERKQSRRATHVPVLHLHPARHDDRT
jgi:hypothetical protein